MDSDDQLFATIAFSPKNLFFVTIFFDLLSFFILKERDALKNITTSLLTFIVLSFFSAKSNLMLSLSFLSFIVSRTATELAEFKKTKRKKKEIDFVLANLIIVSVILFGLIVTCMLNSQVISYYQTTSAVAVGVVKGALFEKILSKVIN